MDSSLRWNDTLINLLKRLRRRPADGALFRNIILDGVATDLADVISGVRGLFALLHILVSCIKVGVMDFFHLICPVEGALGAVVLLFLRTLDKKRVHISKLLFFSSTD